MVQVTLIVKEQSLGIINRCVEGVYIMKKSDEFLYDVRIAHRNVKEALITKKDYDKYIKELPDAEEKGEVLILEDENNKDQLQAEESQEEEAK